MAHNAPGLAPDFAPAPKVHRPSGMEWLVIQLAQAVFFWPWLILLSAPVGYRPRAVEHRRITGEPHKWRIFTGLSTFAWMGGPFILLSLVMPPILLVTIPVMMVVTARKSASPYGLPLREAWATGRRVVSSSGGWVIASRVILGCLAVLGLLILLASAATAFDWRLPSWLQVGFWAGVPVILYAWALAREIGQVFGASAAAEAAELDRFAASVAGALNVRVEQVYENDLLHIQADGSLLLYPVPSATVMRGQTELEQRVENFLPDFTVAQLDASRAHLVTAPEEVLQARALMAETRGIFVASTDEEDSPLRPSAVRFTLAEGTSPTKAATVAQILRSRGHTLVEWSPDQEYAVAAKLDPATLRLRDRLADLAGARPWDLEILVEHDLSVGEVAGALSRVQLMRAPMIEDPTKRGDTWTLRISQLVQPVPATLWSVDDRTALDGTLSVERKADPLAITRPYPFDAPLSVRAVPFAIHPNGSTLELALLSSNMLLGGIPGGGKSGGLTTILAGVSRLEHVAIVGIDPKKVELPLWKNRFSVIAKTEQHASSVLAALQAEMERRYDWLEANELKKIDAPQLSAERPLIVVVIDEMAELLGVATTPEEKKAEAERAVAMRRLVAKGRAAGIVFIGATQKPESNVIPTALRDLIAQRAAYATTTVDMTDTILGKGMGLKGGLAHEIAQRERGVCFLVNEGSRIPQRARTFWIPDEDVKGIADSTAHLRIPLPWLDGLEHAQAVFGQEIQNQAEREANGEAPEVIDILGDFDFGALDVDGFTPPDLSADWGK